MLEIKETYEEQKKRWLKGARLENNKYIVIPDFYYKNFKENPNYNPVFYVVDDETGNLRRIGLQLAYELALEGNFVERTKQYIRN